MEVKQLNSLRTTSKIGQDNNIYFHRLTLFACIVASLNVLYSTNYLISTIIVIIELFILSYFLLKKDAVNYLGCYLVFLSLSLEFGTLLGVENFYGFKNFRIVGINLGILTMIPIVVLSMINGIKVNKIKKRYPYTYKFMSFLITVNFLGIFWGLFQILTNNNNIQNMEGYLKNFISTTYNVVAIPLVILIAFAYIMSRNENGIKLIGSYLYSILIAVGFSLIVSLLTSTYGIYGGVNTLVVSEIVRYLPFGLIFMFYKGNKAIRIDNVILIVGLILALIFNASGKLILATLIIPVVVLILAFKNKDIKLIVFLSVALPLLIIISFNIVDNLLSNSIIFTSKFKEVSSMLEFWNDNWLLNMPLSPRTRIVEFMNIAFEYANKPWFLLVGKGYMGTFIDHTGILSQTFVPGAFSQEQWNNGTFFAVHETINVLFLYNGLIGLFLFFKIIKLSLKNFNVSQWIIIGSYWFLVLYGFSVTSSSFGMAALLMGLIDIDLKNNSIANEGF